MNKIQRKQQKSKAFLRALKERDYYIKRTIKTLNWNKLKAIVMENIKPEHKILFCARSST